MRRHAKASSARSTFGRASSLGSSYRGVFATRGTFEKAKDSGALSHRFGFLALLTCAVYLATATPALAGNGGVYSGISFGPDGTSSTSFSNVQGIAVDQSSQDVYVYDTGEGGKLYKFDSSGAPADFSALSGNVIEGVGAGAAGEEELAVAPAGSPGGTAGDIYVAKSSNVAIYSPSGTLLGELSGGETCGVATDPAGHVFVGVYPSTIREYTPTANPATNADQTDVSSAPIQGICNLAADGLGNIFPVQFSGGVAKLEGLHAGSAMPLDPSARSVAINPTTNDVFANQTNAVAKYDSAGNLLFKFGETGPGAFSGSQGVAVNGTTAQPASGNVYVSSGTGKVEIFYQRLLPEATTEQVAKVSVTSASVTGAVSASGGPDTTCVFQYVPHTAFQGSGFEGAAEAPCSPAGPFTGSVATPVSAELSGLASATIYHYRLLASSANGKTEGSTVTFKTLGPPVVGGQRTATAIFREAVVQAEINPEGSVTTYHVEYGTDTSYGQSTVELSVGSDRTDHTISSRLTGLAPGTTYHWRVVASNSVGPTAGADKSFRTFSQASGSDSCPNEGLRSGPAAALPDCRAYEMISPVDKNNGDIRTLCNGYCLRTALNQSSLNGDKFTYSSYKAFADEPGAPYSNQYLASRSSTGWATEGISPPRHSLFHANVADWSLEVPFKAFMPDLSAAWLTNENITPLSLEATEGVVNLYKRDTATGNYTAMTIHRQAGPKNSTDANGNYLRMEGHSADGSHTLFGATAAYTPDAALGEERQLYDFSDGELHLVSILPNGEANPGPSAAGVTGYGLYFKGGPSLEHAISDDGSRVFWTSLADNEKGGIGPLYVRIDNKRTVLVSAAPASFRTASADGSKVFYETTPDFHGESGPLYEFNVDTETTRLIAGEVVGVLGTSEDASYLYFASKEDLAPGATSGDNNLYLSHGGAITFIVALSATDIGAKAAIPPINNPSDVSRVPIGRTSRVTPDGRHIAFQSTQSLTGYDNTDAVSGEADVEVFTYDATTGQISCASCNPSGARPVGEPLPYPYTANEEKFDSEGNLIMAAAWLNTAENSLYTPRAFSNDGSRLFFNSFDALVPRDNNGQQDVYEWEAEGSGSCGKSVGCVSLISSGESAQKSEFIDADETGQNVFFETKSSLVPQDPGLVDIYVARENGGIAQPPAPKASCEGEACQGPPSPPNDPTPASSAFEGAGNISAKKAHKKQHKKKARHHKKNRHQHRANSNRRASR